MVEQISIGDHLEKLETAGARPIQLTNPLSGELGIKTTEDLDNFIKNAFPQMKLVSENILSAAITVIRAYEADAVRSKLGVPWSCYTF